MLHPCDGQTDGRTIEYSALSIYAIWCRTLKQLDSFPLKHIFQHQHYHHIVIIGRVWLTISAILAAILDSEKATRVASGHPG